MNVVSALTTTTPLTALLVLVSAWLLIGALGLIQPNRIGWVARTLFPLGALIALGMAGMGAMPMGGGMPDMNALMAQAMAMSGGRGGFPGMQMQQAPKEDGVTYLCVTDVQITDRKLGKTIGAPVGGQNASSPKVQQMRMVGHVRQKDLDIPEATPIIQEKVSTGIAGLF